MLTLREHQRARIASRVDPAAGVVSSAVAVALERLQAGRRVEPFAVGRRQVTATQFVGAVAVDGCTIEVLPKIDTDDESTRRNLLTMLAWAGLVPSLELGTAVQTGRVQSLLDPVLGCYLRHLTLEWRRGHLRAYRRVDANRAALRGRLLFAQQLRANLVRPDRFFTRADEYSEDSPPARLLKAALWVVRRFATNPALRRGAAELLDEFAGVADVDPARLAAEPLATDRRLQRFQPLLELARLLVRQAVPDRGAELNTFSLLFDMNVVFERFIGQVIRRRACAGPGQTRLQDHRHSLLRRDGRQQFRLRPDVAIGPADAGPILLDTKWKRLDPRRSNHGVDQSDIYQAYAYGKEYRSPLVVLLYPRAGGGPVTTDYRHPPGGEQAAVVRIATVDLSAPPRRLIGSVAAELRVALRT